ncbi:MAG TPA: archease [Pyrodictiaceae archaeon]|nr:archease [Pyrodictiaceae archaeon]HIQ11160.1 archease [Pyrodictium sp.]HIQ55832.1 archease [Pyrodictium sp.]
MQASQHESYKPFEFEEHTADVLIKAYGRTLEEAFANAARAVFEVITDTNKVEPRECRKVEIEGFDLENALYRWLEEFLIYFDSEGLVFSKFDVDKIERTAEGYRVIGIGCGEQFDPEKHEHRTIVKAITYAQMSIERVDGLWRIRFVVDI